ncbi:MAG: selenophosphate synthetase [Bacteroidota bacterium]|jgi:selenide,water dikinase|nr:selenide, water dikinase SelD [Bacteroidota bacterium]
MEIKLTQYSHGAGCGCKIAPSVLHTMLSGMKSGPHHPTLIVGNDTKDDAAVVDLGDGTGIISTTDFFMPIVDDPHTFGRIAAANAISDIYAMGGTPLVAIAIFGWPIDTLNEVVAGQVLEGGRSICEEAGIPLAGGHSIDCPEPIFGLAVTGRVSLDRLQKNAGAQPGDVLFLTKPLGVGIISTTQKRGDVHPDHLAAAVGSMQALNAVGAELAAIPGVHAMTDVTGFGLMGHLLEMCQGSDTQAVVNGAAVQTFDGVAAYHAQGHVPGGTRRNYASYGAHIDVPEGYTRDLACDPQTSGGLLVAVHPDHARQVQELLSSRGLPDAPIGRMLQREECHPSGHTIAWRD